MPIRLSFVRVMIDNIERWTVLGLNQLRDCHLSPSHRAIRTGDDKPYSRFDVREYLSVSAEPSMRRIIPNTIRPSMSSILSTPVEHRTQHCILVCRSIRFWFYLELQGQNFSFVKGLNDVVGRYTDCRCHGSLFRKARLRFSALHITLI